MDSPVIAANCIYCTTPLVKDPERPHWAHCPSCHPEWTDYIEGVKSFGVFLGMRALARDPRGRPTTRPLPQ